MSVIDIHKKFLGLLSPPGSIPPVNGEILFTTNNVCVHPQGLMSTLPMHHNGFLTVTARVDTLCSTLVVNWSPSNKDPKPPGAIMSTVDHGPPTRESMVGGTMKRSGSSLTLPPDVGDQERIHDDDDDDEQGQLSKSKSTMTLVQATANTAAVVEEVEVAEAPAVVEVQAHHLVVMNGHVFRPPKNQANSAFEIDLGEQRSISVYLRNRAANTGEFIICSHDSVYKILHFHFGQLDQLVKVLREWKQLTKSLRRTRNNLSIHNSFTCVHAELTAHDRHPEEGLYRPLTRDTWQLATDEFGRVQNGAGIQKSVFFCGVSADLRGEVWPYLLKYYRYDMTVLEKADMKRQKLAKYEMINAKRENIVQLRKDEAFWRNVICSIDKDVLRTDRSKPFFKGDGNPNLDTLRRVLLNYSVYTHTPYTQGMSDLLAPLLIEIGVDDENDIFWCFVGLMQQTIFISSPSDRDMEKQLLYLRELLRIFLPDFYEHLLTCGPGAMELLFAHRWILLCFKREFPEDEALRVWEACWAHYQNAYFHLFVCVAVIALYGRDITRHRLASDEILLHFTHLAMQMNGALVLRKARGLLHHFRLRDVIPCSLCDIYTRDDVTAARKSPKLRCQGGPECAGGCAYGGSRDQVGIFKANMTKFFTGNK